MTVSTKVNQFHDFRFAVAMNLKQLEEPKLRACIKCTRLVKERQLTRGCFFELFLQSFLHEKTV